MLFALTRRVLTEARPKVVAKFVYNFGVKGVRSVELHKRRRRRGENFPPFLFISVISSCQLRCQGCWVDVAAPSQKMSLDELNRIVGDAKAHGNAYFGILGGEPFLHPQLLDLFAAHPDCYFQVFTNGQLITDDDRARARAAGQRHAARQHRGLRDRQRRAPRPDCRCSRKTLDGPRGLPPPRPADRRRHERVPDQHRAGVRSLAAPADRDGRALRLVPHLSRRRARTRTRSWRSGRNRCWRCAASSCRCARGCRSRSSTRTGTIAARRCARWRPASAITSDPAGTSSRARSFSSRPSTVRDGAVDLRRR